MAKADLHEQLVMLRGLLRRVLLALLELLLPLALLDVVCPL